MKRIFFIMLLLVTFILADCVTQAEAAQVVKGDLKISMLNIGQGDAILIQTKEQTILIDTAVPKNHLTLVNELEKLNVTKIDKLILTHPHADHIGNAKMLINPSNKELKANPYLEKISVAEVYDNGIASGSPMYKNYLKATETKGITHRSLKAGDTLNFGSGVKFNVLFPTSEFITDLKNTKPKKRGREYNVNNRSIVGKLTYKKFSMMFTGDCEKESEARILADNNAKDLKCDVLKSGHHGAKTSSTEKFVKTISPNYVLISSDNKKKNNIAIGFPKLEPLENYLAAGVDKSHILCTHWNGTITVVSDGKNFSVTPERKEDWIDKWIAQKKKDEKT